MKSCLNIFRWILSIFFILILSILIIAGIPLASLSKVITNPESIKSWLSKGKVYENLADIIIDQISLESMADLPEFINLENKEELKNVFIKIFPAAWIQTNVESAIDGGYEWLEGKTDLPYFEIDFSENKDTMLDEIVNYFTSSLETLPTCTEAEMLSMQNEGKDFNPIDATCLPPGFDKNNLGEIEKELENKLNEIEIYEKGKIRSTEFITIDSVITQNVQKVYEIFKNLPVIITFSIIVISLILFITIPGLSTSFLIVGIIWVVGSSILLFGSFFLQNRFDSVYQDQINKIPAEQVEVISNIFKQPIQIATLDIQAQLSQFAIIIVVLGFIFTFGGFILKFSKRRYYIKDDEPVSFDKNIKLGEKSHQTEQGVKKM